MTRPSVQGRTKEEIAPVDAPCLRNVVFNVYCAIQKSEARALNAERRVPCLPMPLSGSTYARRAIAGVVNRGDGGGLEGLEGRGVCAASIILTFY